MNDMDRGAIAALDLLVRGNTVTEDETSWQEHAEGIRAAVKEGGIGLAVRREIEFERSLNVPGEFSVNQTYGRFPTSLRTLARPGLSDAEARAEGWPEGDERGSADIAPIRLFDNDRDLLRSLLEWCADHGIGPVPDPGDIEDVVNDYLDDQLVAAAEQASDD